MNHVFLCGFMGCGKTTVGRAAARLAGVSFIDLDKVIAAQAGKTIPEIFAEDGEACFRELEASLLAEEAASARPSIVATGGGALVSPSNAALCRKHGSVVFLDVPFEVCYSRIHRDPNRPVAAARSREELLELFEQRREHYLAGSSLTLQNGPLDTLAERVAGLLPRQDG